MMGTFPFQQMHIPSFQTRRFIYFFYSTSVYGRLNIFFVLFCFCLDKTMSNLTMSYWILGSCDEHFKLFPDI